MFTERVRTKRKLTNDQQSTRDTASRQIITGTGDALPPQVDSKRLHNVPGRATNDPFAEVGIH